MRKITALVVILIITVVAGLATLDGTAYGQRRIVKGVDFSGQTISPCDFSNTDIWNSSFDAANLEACNFSNARIYDSSFRGSVLSFSRFTNAKIIKSTFSSSNLTFADFSGATMLKNNFNKSRLSSALFAGTILTSNRGTRLIGDKTVMVATLRDRNKFQWVTFHDRLDYDAILADPARLIEPARRAFQARRDAAWQARVQVMKSAATSRRDVIRWKAK